MDRREFLKGSAALFAAGLGGAPFVTGCGTQPRAVVSRGNAAEAGFDHIVVCMMENRSFDHWLGWLPGANGRQEGLSFVDRDGVTHSTHHLTAPASCAFADPDHSYDAGRTQFADGANSGFLQTGPDTFPIGYYRADDLPFWGGAAPAWTVCDNYFAATMSSTFPNRFYQHAGRSDRHRNSLDISELPTIWDRLTEAGLEARYYYSDAPFLALWGIKYAPITRSFDGFLEDCAAGRLPNVSFVDPRFLLPPFGNSGDYHPPSDIRYGEQFVSSVYRAVTTSPNWGRTVLVFNFDEWGGFYDHVPPPVGEDLDPGLALRGFRVPCMVVSPLARRGHVAHDLYDHTSVLKMIEWAWGLRSLAPRDDAANNLADVLDLGGVPDLEVEQYPVADFAPTDCGAELTASFQAALRRLAHDLGFPTT